MLRRQNEPTGDGAVSLTIAGRKVTAWRGETVAAAVLAAGISATRNAPVSAEPRAPYCLMGVCFECLMTIDGAANRQACLVPVVEGMRVDLQLERPRLGASSDAG